MTELPDIRWIDVDTELTRQFALLSEYSDDLEEAANAFARVIALDEGEVADLNADVRIHLVSAGMIAYFRCYMTNKRPNLASFVETPTDMAATHESARKYRNLAIAHADGGDKKMSVAVELVRMPEGVTVGQIWPVSIVVECPTEFIEDMSELIGQLQIAVHFKQVELRAQLAKALSRIDIDDLWRRPEVDVSPRTWDPSAKRHRRE